MTHSEDQSDQVVPIDHALDHPTVRRGTRLFRGQWISLAVMLLALGVTVLVRDMTELPVLAALACFTGAGVSLWVGEWMVRSLRHEYRYQDHSEDQVKNQAEGQEHPSSPWP